MRTTRRPHLWSFGPRTTARETERIHGNPLTGQMLRSHNNIEKALNILCIVGSHALLNSPLNLIIDEVTTVDLLQAVRMAVKEQVDVKMATTGLIPSLTHKVLTEELCQGVIVEEHARYHRRKLVRISRIGESNVINVHDPLGMYLIATTTVPSITKSLTELCKSSRPWLGT
jgi:hypothetical protein